MVKNFLARTASGDRALTGRRRDKMRSYCALTWLRIAGVMARRAPGWRINPWVAISAGIALAILAANGSRLYAAIDRLINPPPANLIIIAPVGSETV
jgi:hypothetical protein